MPRLDEFADAVEDRTGYSFGKVAVAVIGIAVYILGLAVIYSAA